jgi:hypothetical protein
MPPPSLLLSPQQLTQLIPLVPVLVSWLRNAEPKNAGERFMRAGADMDGTQQSLRELLNAMNFNQGDLTNVQLRYILSCHDVSYWATGIRVVLGESDPRTVPAEIGSVLMSTLTQLHDADDTDEIAKVMGATLDQLPRSNFVALGEFCALLRDTGGQDNISQLACLVGPMLLAPRIGTITTTMTSAATAVMEFLIEECESVFGRICCYPGKKPAMGVRKAPPQMQRRASRQVLGGGGGNGSTLGLPGTPNPASPRAVQSPGGGGIGDRKPSNVGLAPPPGLGGGVGNGAPPGNSPQRQPTDSEIALAKTNKRKDQLRAFFQFRANDRVKDMSECVDQLFDNHDFEDIAKGLWERYNMLPPGWQFDLTELRSAGSNKLDWFVPTEVGMQKGKNAQGRPISFVPASKPSAQPEKLGKIDLIINEIIDTEQTYRENLEELLQSYIVQVREIATGRKGPEAAQELGLTASEVEKIFGWRIGEITKVSATFQKKLEVVSLVRGPTRNPIGRQGFVAQAFIDIAEDLHVYAPYVSAHKTSLQTLEKALAAIQSKDVKKGGVGALGAALLGGGNNKKEATTFVKLWEVVSNASPRLKGQAIQSLLIMPIQRVPRYKLLLNELIKGTDKEHAAYPLLQEALDQVSVAAVQINEALRQHEKIAKMLGSDVISPSISEKGEGGKIKQGYIDA